MRVFSIMSIYLLGTIILFNLPSADAFVTPQSHVAGKRNQIPSSTAVAEKKEDKLQDEDDLQEQVDNFLDKQFFDPTSQENGPLLQWFADLVESDYEAAEALYAGTFFVILVVAAQEVLRMNLYGDAYVPFTRIGSGGGLW